MRIKWISETDFDTVIKEAGGSRIFEEGSVDYILNESLIELKLVEEEGFEKLARQKKIAEIFSRHQPKRPVVLIRPNLLDDESQKSYYNAVSGPIDSRGLVFLEKPLNLFNF